MRDIIRDKKRQVLKSGIIIFLLFLFCFSSTSFKPGIKINEAVENPDSLRNDLNIFRDKLNAIFPSLNRYLDKKATDHLFDSCYASINKNTTETDLFNMIKFIMSAVKDGHLSATPSLKMVNYFNEKAVFFPLKLVFIEDKTYVISSSLSGLPPGTEIVSIGKRPIDQIRKELFKFTVSDGYIETKKYKVLDNSFPFYYFRVYGEQKQFDVEYRTKKGKLRYIKIDAVPIGKFPQLETEPDHLLDLSFTGDVTILTIKSFDRSALKETNEDLPSYIDKSFQAIYYKKARNLIIDVRGNGGGRDLYGSLLYSYLTNNPFSYYRSLTSKTSDLPYDQFTSPATSYNNLDISMLENIGPQEFKLKSIAHPNLNPMEPNRTNFKGKIWFLTDGLSFSVTAEFCALAKSNNLGVFIGEETGGGYEGNTSGANVEVILPYTGISVSIPTIRYEMDVIKAEVAGRGVIPDHIVKPGIKDVINKKDVQMEFAIKLATGK